jgi:hypothetical protein
MKRFYVLLLLATTMLACNNAPIESGEKEEGENDEKEEVSMPYKVPNNPDWQRGSIANVAVAMHALKAYETNAMEGLQQYLADTVEFHGDNFSFEGPRDSLINQMKQQRDGYRNIVVNMHDYKSVKSKARNKEWVSLWYTQTTTHKNGRVDSVFVMDDIQIKNGKVSEIDSKIRRLPGKK